jgi:glycosyltransferase involved in cell wall biosynthesis|tara:strand:- start:2820 stop:3575 length:756 start_codon:yes stop_codon:yes gene_type:complete
MSLSVVIPVYNEQEIIEKVVRNINQQIISKIPDSEVIIVNDCSTDNTLSILQKLSKEFKKIKIITPSKNGGHGKSIRLGFLNAKKDWVFHIDSDNQFDPKEYWKLDKFKSKYDYVYGYRKKRYDPVHRKILTTSLRFSNLVIFGTFMKDTNSAFKLINNKALQHILSIVPENAFAPSIMITLLAKKLGYRIKLVGVTHFQRKTGEVSIQGGKLAKVCLSGAKDMLKFRIKTLILSSNEFRKAKQIRNGMKN